MVKAGGDLSHSRIKGAIAPEELLKPAAVGRQKEEPEFQEADPKEGFNVRNFQIQACKMATVSDLVVYGDAKTPKEDVVKLAKRMARAQTAWQKKTEGPNATSRLFNTFILQGEYCQHTLAEMKLTYLQTPGKSSSAIIQTLCSSMEKDV